MSRVTWHSPCPNYWSRDDDMKTHITDITQVIQLAVAPIFLLSEGVAPRCGFMSDNRELLKEATNKMTIYNTRRKKGFRCLFALVTVTVLAVPYLAFGAGRAVGQFGQLHGFWDAR